MGVDTRHERTDSQVLADFLNSAPPQHWIELFTTALELQDACGRPQLPIEEMSLMYCGEDDYVPIDTDPARNLLSKLNFLLFKYPTFTSVTLKGVGDLETYEELYILEEADMPERADQYQIFVNLLLRLLKQGRLDRVRRCKCCDEWIGAKRVDQCFCGTRCRQRYFESRPDVRKLRNEVRRKSYRNMIERDRICRRLNGSGSKRRSDA